MSKMIKEYKELLNNDSFPNIHEFYTKTTSFFNKYSKDLGGVVFETNFYRFIQSWDHEIVNSLTLQSHGALNDEWVVFLPVHLYNVQDIDVFCNMLDNLVYDYVDRSKRIHFKLVNSSFNYVPEEIFIDEEVKSINVTNDAYKRLTFIKIMFNEIDSYPNLIKNFEEFKTNYKNAVIKENNIKETESILLNNSSKYHKIKNSLYSINRAEQEFQVTKNKLIHEELMLKESFRDKIKKSTTKYEPFNASSILSDRYNIQEKSKKSSNSKYLEELDGDINLGEDPEPQAEIPQIQRVENNIRWVNHADPMAEGPRNAIEF